MKKAALFDLDGVLIDSETLYTQFWQRVGEIHHLPSPTFAYDIKGTTLKDILETHFSDPEVRKDVDRLLHEFENEVLYPVFPGALELVDALRARGLKTVIVTSSDEKKMHFLCRQHPDFLPHFDAVVTAEDVGNSKPDPEPYLVGAVRSASVRPTVLFSRILFRGFSPDALPGAKSLVWQLRIRLMQSAHTATSSLPLLQVLPAQLRLCSHSSLRGLNILPRSRVVI